jgi:hypothetical protein
MRLRYFYCLLMWEAKQAVIVMQRAAKFLARITVDS